MVVRIIDDQELRTEIRQKIKDNGGYCPCKLLKNEDTKCMCKEFLQSPMGTTCSCGLYIKIEE